MKRLLLALFLFLTPAALAQFGGSSGMAYGIYGGGTLPTHCSPLGRNFFVKTGAAAGGYFCPTTDTWSGPFSLGGAGTYLKADGSVTGATGSIQPFTLGVNVGNGSASAPTYSFSASPALGIFSLGVNKLGIHFDNAFAGGQTVEFTDPSGIQPMIRTSTDAGADLGDATHNWNDIWTYILALTDIGAGTTQTNIVSAAGKVGTHIALDNSAYTGNHTVAFQDVGGNLMLAATNGSTTTVAHGSATGLSTFGAVVSADLNITGTTCTNQVLSALSSTAAGTCHSVAFADMATQATNTIVGNATAGSAVPTALAIGSCSAASSALTWTTNSGFGCNTITAGITNTAAANELGMSNGTNIVASGLFDATAGTITTNAGTAAGLVATAPTAAASTAAGKNASLTASAATAGTSNAGAAAGGDAVITAGAAARLASGFARGGQVQLVPGATIGGGQPGAVIVTDNASLNYPDYSSSVDNTAGIAFPAAATVTINGGNIEYGRLASGVLKLPGYLYFGAATTTPDVGFIRQAASDLRLVNSSFACCGRLDLGGLAPNINATAKTANYTTTATDYALLATTAGGAFTITLSSTNAAAGQIYVIKMTATSANALTLSPSSGNIDGGASYTITPTTVKEAATVQFDGTNWWVIGSYSGLL